jgi:hypothetical protein
MVILLSDLLGVKNRWATGGRAAAEGAFTTLRTLVVTALRNIPVTGLQQGTIESDTVALVFDTPQNAISAGLSIYQMAFSGPEDDESDRWWLRGAILPLHPEEALRAPRRLSPPLSQIEFVQLAGSLLDAISVEKAGFKGMRLLAHNSLVTPEVRQAFRMTVNGRFMIPFRQMEYTQYPPSLNGQFQDVLWMASDDPSIWAARKQAMASRLRWSAPHQEELSHASATQVLFNETDLILGNLARRQVT